MSDVAVQDDIVVNHDTSRADDIAEVGKKVSRMAEIPIVAIVKSDVALRDAQEDTEEFQLLVQSIRQRGVLQSILVREVNTEYGMKYGLIDGLQRYTAAKLAGLEKIPARIVTMDDAELLEAQFISNVNRIATKPAEMSKHLIRILAHNPMMTISDLAERICQSKTFVEQRLSLNKLMPEIQEMVNAGKIHLTNAYILSKLPEDQQAEHVDAAISESQRTFVPRMKEILKGLRDAKRQGRDGTSPEWKPVQHLQKVSVVKEEYEALTTGNGDSRIAHVLETQGVEVTPSVKQLVTLVVAWALNYDPVSQEEQRLKAEVQKKKTEEKKQALKAQREAQKQAAAAEAAADITKI